MTKPDDSTTTTLDVLDRPLMYHESNREVHEDERRLLIAKLLKFDKYYGWRTIIPDGKLRKRVHDELAERYPELWSVEK